MVFILPWSESRVWEVLHPPHVVRGVIPPNKQPIGGSEMQEWTVEVAYVFNLTVHAETMSKAVYEAGKLEDRMRDAGDDPMRYASREYSAHPEGRVES